MANDLNQCNFIGRAGRDPEQRFSASGMEVTNFSLAVGYKYKETESTEWINVVCFGKLASLVSQYVEKGKQLFISGRMQTDKWQDKDGEAGTFEILDPDDGVTVIAEITPDPTTPYKIVTIL